MIDWQRNEEYLRLKADFDIYYQKKLLPKLRKSENLRLLYLFMFVALVFMGIIFYPAILQFLLANNNENDYIIGFILGASCLIIMLLCGPLFKYRKKIKPQIMPDFANFFGTFSYYFGGKIDDDYLQQSDLFGKYNSNMGDDYFSGVYNDVRITIAEEKLEQKKQDFNGFEVNKKVFRGVCILFEMNKNFKGRTVVLQDKGLLNIFNRVKSLQNIKLEDIHFEKLFEVYSDDQIEARYLLTTGFMERMMKLCELYEGKSIQFCFNRNTLLLAITTKQDMFEAHSFFGSNINKKHIDLVFEQFYTIFSIVKLLKLNQKIGI